MALRNLCCSGLVARDLLAYACFEEISGEAVLIFLYLNIIAVKKAKKMFYHLKKFPDGNILKS